MGALKYFHKKKRRLIKGFFRDPANTHAPLDLMEIHK